MGCGPLAGTVETEAGPAARARPLSGRPRARLSLHDAFSGSLGAGSGPPLPGAPPQEMPSFGQAIPRMRAKSLPTERPPTKTRTRGKTAVPLDSRHPKKTALPANTPQDRSLHVAGRKRESTGSEVGDRVVRNPGRNFGDPRYRNAYPLLGKLLGRHPHPKATWYYWIPSDAPKAPPLIRTWPTGSRRAGGRTQRQRWPAPPEKHAPKRRPP